MGHTGDAEGQEALQEALHERTGMEADGATSGVRTSQDRGFSVGAADPSGLSCHCHKVG